MNYLSLLNGVLLGVLTFFLFRLSRESKRLVETNEHLQMMLHLAAHTTRLVLAKSNGMVSCDICHGSLRPDEQIGVVFHEGNEPMLVHDGCVPDEYR